MSSEITAKTIQIRKGDTSLKRVNNIKTHLKNDDQVPIMLINKDNSFQKLVAIVEKVKAELLLENMAFHQYNKLEYTVKSESGLNGTSVPVHTTSLLKNPNSKLCIPSISIIISREKIKELDNDSNWEYQSE